MRDMRTRLMKIIYLIFINLINLKKKLTDESFREYDK